MTERHLKLAIDLLSLAFLIAFIFTTSPAAMHKLRAELRWLTYYLALVQWNAAHVTRGSSPAWLREALLVRGRFAT